MCLAIPQEVIEIKGGKALVRHGLKTNRVNLSLVKNIKIGDFLLAHEDLAIGKVSKSNAKKILKVISELRK